MTAKTCEHRFRLNLSLSLFLLFSTFKKNSHSHRLWCFAMQFLRLSAPLFPSLRYFFFLHYSSRSARTNLPTDRPTNANAHARTSNRLPRVLRSSRIEGAPKLDAYFFLFGCDYVAVVERSFRFLILLPRVASRRSSHHQSPSPSPSPLGRLVSSHTHSRN